MRIEIWPLRIFYLTVLTGAELPLPGHRRHVEELRDAAERPLTRSLASRARMGWMPVPVRDQFE